jgi:hypothetical protein
MPLKIGQLSFDKLNGPVSFRCLKPSTGLLKRGINANVLLCLGDQHHSRNKVCDLTTHDQTNPPRTLSVFTSLFLRILDSLGTQECPVQYFVEAFFPTHFLTSGNATSLMESLSVYLGEEYKPWVYTVDDQTVMTWVAKFHLECFVQSDNILLQCPTSNVRYHFADLRLGQTFAKLNKQHAQSLANDAIRSVSQEFYSPVTSAILNLGKTHDTFSRDRKRHIYKHSVNMYENLLYTTILEVQSPYRSRSRGKVATINDTSIFEILRKLFDEPEECAKILFDPSSRYIRKSSMLYTAIQQSVPANYTTEVWVRWCTDIFCKYFEFVVENDTELQNSKDAVLESIATYGVMTETLEKYTDVTGRLFDMSKHDKMVNVQLPFSEEQTEFYRDVKKTLLKYQTAYDIIATTVLVPFNDMYTLFSSWKTGGYSPMTVYHAGEFHCEQITKFLTERGLYEFATPSVVPVDSKVNRCLDMSQQDYNVDAAILSTLSQSTFHADLKNKYRIVFNRLNVLGVKLYKQVLSGRLVLEQELSKRIKTFELTEEQAVDSLDLQPMAVKQVFIPAEYTKKLKF